MNFLVQLAPYAKAVVAFLSLLVPFLTALIIVLNDAINNHYDGSHVALLIAAAAALGGGTKAVYETRNVPKNITQGALDE